MIARSIAGLVLAFGVSATAHAQLEPFTDYDIDQRVSQVTLVKVDNNMMDDYLEGLRDTWVAANAVAKELGHIEDYAIYASDLQASGDFNLMLVVSFKTTADLAPSKQRYDAFMAAWGEDRVQRNREISKDYPSMRSISGEYQVRKITIK